MTFHKSHTISLSVLIFSLLITWLVWRYTGNLIDEKKEVLFNDGTQEMEFLLKYRLDDYIAALYGLQSLFAGHAKVGIQTWNGYCENLAAHGMIPGIYSLSFSSGVGSVYHKPGLKRSQEQHYIVDYIWPLQEHKNASGINELPDSVRRLLIERTLDTGKPVASERIELTSESGQSGSGFVICLPVYDFGRELTTLEERRLAFQGVVAAVFKVNELLGEVIKSIIRPADIDIEIFDSQDLLKSNLYYNDDDVLDAYVSNKQHLFSRISHLNVYGRPWSIYFSTKSGFGLSRTEAVLPFYVLSTGIIFSILLASTIFSLTNSRIQALQLAEQMTKDLEKQRAISMRSDRLRSLGQMAAGIAHELNQPLVGVRGLAEHILIGKERGWKFDEQTIREKISLIVDQADRMSHIIEHVRIFAREAGKPEVRPVSINDVVESSIDLLSAQFSSHGLTLDKDLGVGLPAILANPFSLEEVFLNLIINGRDAVEERQQSDPELKSPGVLLRTGELNKNGRSMVKIEVMDNGVGIPEDVQGKIFDPFFTTKAPDKGTGLGLAIAKSIIEEFGGHLSIESAPVEGTTITVTLPADPDSKHEG